MTARSQRPTLAPDDPSRTFGAKEFAPASSPKSSNSLNSFKLFNPFATFIRYLAKQCRLIWTLGRVWYVPAIPPGNSVHGCDGRL